MTLRVVGAGLPRTGTTSLKYALGRLLDAPCYHMRDVIGNIDDVLTWRDAFRGDSPDWDVFLSGYAAGVDWPISRFWPELSARYPDAIVLLSRRDSPETWYTSMDKTILGRARMLRDGANVHAENPPPWMAGATPEHLRAMDEMWDGMGGDILAAPDDPQATMAAYERYLAEVRAGAPAGRLLEWAPGDGWEPLCAALGVPVPDEPFPHENSAETMTAHLREAGLTD